MQSIETAAHIAAKILTAAKQKGFGPDGQSTPSGIVIPQSEFKNTNVEEVLKKLNTGDDKKWYAMTPTLQCPEEFRRAFEDQTDVILDPTFFLISKK